MAFGAAQSEASKLKSAVDELVEEQGRIAQEISSYASGQIRSGQLILIVLSIAAVIGATLVAWLYVGRSIARRLGLLSDAMRRIANGDFNVDIQDSRGDEIAEMGRTLLFFRQATADAANARRKESDQTRTLESRRQLVEGATREFEDAVSNIVKTLDRAAAAMDASAREMANSATSQSRTGAGDRSSVGTGDDKCRDRGDGRRGNRPIDRTYRGPRREFRDDCESGNRRGKGNYRCGRKSVCIGRRNRRSQRPHQQHCRADKSACAQRNNRGRPRRRSRPWFAVVAQEVKGLATQTGKATEEITRHIVSIEQTTQRSVQAIKKIAATIEQLSDVANDVAVAMRQQDAVTQEIARNAGAAAEGHTRCVRECHRSFKQRRENRSGRLDRFDCGGRTGGAITSAAAGSRALSGAGSRRFVAAAYGGRGPISSVPTNPVMLADYTAACLEPKATQRFAPASRSGEKPDLRAWRRPIVVGTRKGVETMCGEPAADLAR